MRNPNSEAQQTRIIIKYDIVNRDAQKSSSERGTAEDLGGNVILRKYVFEFVWKVAIVSDDFLK